QDLVGRHDPPDDQSPYEGFAHLSHSRDADDLLSVHSTHSWPRVFLRSAPPSRDPVGAPQNSDAISVPVLWHTRLLGTTSSESRVRFPFATSVPVGVESDSRRLLELVCARLARPSLSRSEAGACPA